MWFLVAMLDICEWIFAQIVGVFGIKYKTAQEEMCERLEELWRLAGSGLEETQRLREADRRLRRWEEELELRERALKLHKRELNFLGQHEQVPTNSNRTRYIN